MTQCVVQSIPLGGPIALFILPVNTLQLPQQVVVEWCRLLLIQNSSLRSGEREFLLLLFES